MDDLGDSHLRHTRSLGRRRVRRRRRRRKIHAHDANTARRTPPQTAEYCRMDPWLKRGSLHQERCSIRWWVHRLQLPPAESRRKNGKLSGLHSPPMLELKRRGDCKRVEDNAVLLAERARLNLPSNFDHLRFISRWSSRGRCELHEGSHKLCAVQSCKKSISSKNTAPHGIVMPFSKSAHSSVGRASDCRVSVE